ncbi:conserved hypothetical protein [Candidatus Terasakiella magnetica]|nr:conserved hypothetical protein [Candidatus Terasakiella magnetica]
MAPLDCAKSALAAVDTKQIVYRFFVGTDQSQTVDLLFDKKTFRLLIPETAPRPDWAKLSHQRCANCTLPDDCSYCPAALGIAMFLPAFENRVSHEKTVVEVETPNRTIVAKTTFQSAMASLMGLVCATSGCPLTRFLRPMARFHMPFSDEQETLFRSFSSWLLAGYVESRMAGVGVCVTLDGLKGKYQDLSIMNAALGNRIRNSVKRDAALNAVIILDLFAQIAPDNIDNGFEDILETFTVEEDD